MSTQPVFIYVIATKGERWPSAPVKVGISENPNARLKDLQVANPHDLVLLACFAAPTRATAKTVERVAHEALEDDAMRGEWFDACPFHVTGLICEIYRLIAEETSDAAPDGFDLLEWSFAAGNMRQLNKFMDFLKERGETLQ